MRSSFSRPSPESTPSATFHEAILASVSGVRDSLPKEHHKHFETLRQEIIDFAASHNIPREALAKPDLLREAANKLSTSDLERLANLLERFRHLIVEKKPWTNKEALEYAEVHYHLKEQYTSQVELLEQVGILHPKKESKQIQSLSSLFRSLLPFGKKKRPEVPVPSETSETFYITGIDGKEYPIPTLEQIASRLFERREELKTKHDQGFTKLLLVPFGMSLDALQETLKQFLLSYKHSHPTFNLDTDKPLWTWEDYQGVDIGDSPKLVYYPQSFTEEGHGGKTKTQILEGQGDPTPTYGRGSLAHPFPGWTIHLLQPSNMDEQDTETLKGFAPIPRKGQGTPQGDLTSRPSLEAGKSPNEYLSLLREVQNDPNSPYFQESGMTPEDWIIAFMIHLTETGQPLDNWQNNKESISYLTGAFFSSSTFVPYAYWDRDHWQAILLRDDPHFRDGDIGVRSSVII